MKHTIKKLKSIGTGITLSMIILLPLCHAWNEHIKKLIEDFHNNRVTLSSDDIQRIPDHELLDGNTTLFDHLLRQNYTAAREQILTLLIKHSPFLNTTGNLVRLFIPSADKPSECTPFADGMKKKYNDALCALLEKVPRDRQAPHSGKIMAAIEEDNGYFHKSIIDGNEKLTLALINKGALISQAMIKDILDIGSSKVVFEKMVEAVIMQNKELLLTNSFGETVLSTALAKGYHECANTITKALSLDTAALVHRAESDVQDGAHLLQKIEPALHETRVLVDTPVVKEKKNFGKKLKLGLCTALGCFFIGGTLLLKHLNTQDKNKEERPPKLL